MKNNDTSTILLSCLGLILLIAIGVFLKGWAVQWLWNSFLIGWAGFALPVMSWGKAFCVGVCLTIATQGISGSSNK